MRLAVSIFFATAAVWAEDAAAIMAKVAANHERSTDARRQYVYQQKIRSSLVRSSGDVARREKREYSVFPGETNTEKKLVSFTGEYRKGKQMVPYSESGFHHKGLDLDADLLKELTDNLTNEKDSRDGIPRSLFPLQSRVLERYKFTLKGESSYQGRRTYEIAFEPRERKSCITLGDDDEDCDGDAWKGTAWIDAADLEPAKILTDMAFKIPWGVRVFFGINMRQTGFSINYKRVAENVWFPASYGTEFQLEVFWGYKRTITMSLESSGFQKTETTSTIRYASPE